MIPESLFLRLNPWLRGGEPELPAKYIHRRAEIRLGNWTDPERVVVVSGPRRSGKSTLMRFMIRKLLQDVPSGRIVYLNADHVSVRELVSDTSALLDTLEALPRGRPDYLFIDEVQRLTEPGLSIKQLVDLGTGIRIAVSGSSSLSVRSQAREHLVGRKLDVFLPPLSFAELVMAEPHLAELAHASFEELRRQWPLAGKGLLDISDRLAIIGGYPDVWLAAGHDQSRERLVELYDTYVRRDVVDFLRVDDPAPFNRLVRLLALQVGSGINRASLAGEAGLSLRELERHLAILSDTHVSRIVPPFFTNRRREIVKSPKVYFIDCGLRNVLLNQLTDIENRPDRGQLTENLVMSETAKVVPQLAEQHFWRTQAGAEVDLVVLHGDRLAAIEIKSGSLLGRGPSRGYHSFLRSYSPDLRLLVNRDDFNDPRSGQPQALPMPVFLLLMERLFENFRLDDSADA